MDTKALRQKILDLAIRGKLVPQDPNDEPASVLLEKIREQKQQMFKEGKLKKKDIKNDSIIFKGEDNLHYEKFQDGTVKCIEDEIPFDVPEGWAWCRLNSIVDVRDGTHDTPTYVDKGIPLITSKNLVEGGIDYSNVKYISEKDAISINERSGVNIGDILFAMIGTIGNPSMVTEDILISIKNVALFKFTFSKNLSNYFVMYFLDYAQEDMKNKPSGGLQPFVSLNFLRTYLVPVPPVEEQQRIVSILADSINKIRNIDVLKNELTASVKKAKSKILDLAIRGKLVPQDPNDEPASVLLERIRAEKEELINQGKIKRDKKESVIFKGDDNSYYQRVEAEGATVIQRIDVPSTWEVCHLQDISYPISSIGMQIKSEETQKDGLFPVISQGKSYIDGYCSDESKVIYDFPIILFGDHTRNVKYIDFPFIVGADGTKLHKIIQANEKYVYYWMCHASEHIADRGYARHYNLLQKKCFMLPPFAEQNRIVNCIEKLFAQLNSICDALS